MRLASLLVPLLLFVSDFTWAQEKMNTKQTQQAMGVGSSAPVQKIDATCLLISQDGSSFSTLSFTTPKFAKYPESATKDNGLGNAEEVVKGTLSAQEAKIPLEVSCPTDTVNSKKAAGVVANPEFVIFHVVRWSPAPGGSGARSEDRWYLYDRRKGKDPHFPLKALRPHVTDDVRILGSRSVALIALHFGIDTSCSVEYSVSAQSKTAVPVQELRSLLEYAATAFGFKVPGAEAPGGPEPVAVGVYGSALLSGITKLPADVKIDTALSGSPTQQNPVQDANVHWGKNVAIGCSKKAPKPDTQAGAQSDGKPAVQGCCCCNKTDKADLSPGNGNAIITPKNNKSNDQPNGGNNTTSNQPTSGNNPAKKQDQPTPAFTQTFDNEGLYHWDVGLAVPVTGRQETTFGATDNIVRSHTSTRQDLYATFHFFPLPVDLKAKNSFVGFSIMGGIPVANRPFNNPVAGASFGFNMFGLRLLPWAAALLQKDFRPRTLTIGSSASPAALKADLVGTRVTKLMVGITFSVKDAQSIFFKINNTGADYTAKDKSATGSSKKSPGK